MKTYLLVFLIIFITFEGPLDDDREFLEKYQVSVAKRGNFNELPKKGDQVTVHYTGRLLSGKKFDSSKDRNQPFQFSVGVGQVIKCWDEVIMKLTLGDVVTVICPANLAYGSRGAGGLIPPNSDLEFEIEMLGFREHKLSDL